MFVVLVGSVFTTFVLRARRWSGARRISASSSSSPCGSGSPCCSPTSPRRWPKAGARPRPTTLRKTRRDTPAKRSADRREPRPLQPVSVQRRSSPATWCCARPGDVIPGDGEVVEGVASVDESAITGESAPVIRESGGDRSAVTGGTKVLSDQLIIQITANPGETFLDRMIALVEGASRQKTPNEIALTILLVRAHDHLPAGHRHPPAVRDLQRRRRRGVDPRSRSWSASFRRRSAACSRPSASRAWTGSSSTTSSR